MKLEGADFAEVLADAQKLGYAETPPDLDIDGHDAAHKTGILASLAHGFWVSPKKIHVEGIRHISAMDIKFAGELGYTIKLLGIVKTECGKRKADKCRVQVSVYPTLVPNAHVLASVNDVFNAVFVRGDIVGDTLFYGRGAGKDATASAVLSDLADAALDLKFGNETPRCRRSCRTNVPARSCRLKKSSRSILSGSTSWTSPACWRKSRRFLGRRKSAFRPSSSPKATKAKACR